MKRASIFLFILSVVIFSCKPNKKKLILGKWNAVALVNPGMDSFFANSQNYIDTIGKNNDPATNMALYGATNMDSMRQLLQLEYDSARNQQRNAVVNTWFNFRKDSIVILAFNNSIDSSKWYLNGKDELVLVDLNNPKGTGAADDKLSMQILELNDTALQLKFVENGSFSTVTFHHEKK